MGRTACTEPQCLYKGALYSINVYISSHAAFKELQGKKDTFVPASTSKAYTGVGWGDTAPLILNLVSGRTGVVNITRRPFYSHLPPLLSILNKETPYLLHRGTEKV